MKAPFFTLLATLVFTAGCASHKPEPEAKNEVKPEYLPLTSPGSQLALLPNPVRQTIRAEAGAAEIDTITKVAGTNPDVYKVTFRDALANPPLYVASDGSLVDPSTIAAVGAPPILGESAQGGAAANLPDPVKRTLQSVAPQAPIADVRRTERVIYEVDFADPIAHPPLFIGEDGVILKEMTGP